MSVKPKAETVKTKEDDEWAEPKDNDEWVEPKDNVDWAESKDDGVSNEEPEWVGSKEGAGAKSKEETGSSEGTEGTKESPMFVPKGRFYFHDSRCDAESEGEEGEKKRIL